MREFDVFRNEGGTYRIVKNGWSWPAFLFGPLWAIVSGLWLLGFGMLLLEMLLNSALMILSEMINSAESEDAATFALVALVVVALAFATRLMFGGLGNSRRRERYLAAGFAHVSSVEARDKRHALNQVRQAITSNPVDRAPRPDAKERMASAKTSTRTIGENNSGHELTANVNVARPSLFPPSWLGWIIAAASVIAILDAPYGYYQLLRLVVTGYAGYMSLLYFRNRQAAAGWLFAFAALLYNPVFVIEMSKEVHAVINLAVAGLILWELKFSRQDVLLAQPA